MMAEMLEVQLEEAQQTRQKISCLCGFSSPDNNSTEMIEVEIIILHFFAYLFVTFFSLG